MNKTGIKYLKKYLDMAFIYLYICPLFLRTFFFSPKPFGKKTQIFLKLISNGQIYNVCLIRREIRFSGILPINFRHQTFNN
jgi:hypothetical protein